MGGDAGHELKLGDELFGDGLRSERLDQLHVVDALVVRGGNCPRVDLRAARQVRVRAHRTPAGGTRAHMLIARVCNLHGRDARLDLCHRRELGLQARALVGVRVSHALSMSTRSRRPRGNFPTACVCPTA